MVITYHKGHCIKIVQGDTTLVLNPHDKKSSFGGVRFGADVALVSLNHEDFAGTEGLSSGSKSPFIIDTPGEYEVGSVSVRGYGVRTTYAGVERFNTIYQVHFEDMNIVVLGALGSTDVDPKILGEFGDIDILVLPIGGGDILDVPAASKFATKLEAHCIIPVGYDKASLTTFLKELESDAAPVEKFTTKAKDVQQMEAEVVVLAA